MSAVTRDEFLALPPIVALGVVYDLAAPKLASQPIPDYPKPPRYDGRLGRGKKGFSWMSELTLDSLQWWQGKKSESAASGSEYAERDAKTAATLGNWIAWRRIEPTAAWNGTRGDDRVTAKPPSRDPECHQWGPRTEKPNGAPPPASTEGDANEDFSV